MLRRIVVSLPCTTVLAASPAQAGDEGDALGHIEVTGSRISYRDLH